MVWHSLVYIHLYELQHLYEVFTACGALCDGVVTTSYRTALYTAKSSGKNQLDSFHDDDAEDDDDVADVSDADGGNGGAPC